MVFYIYKMKGINYIGSTNNIKTRTRLHNVACYNTNSRAYNFSIYKYIREKKMNIELEILGVYKRECTKRIKLLVEQFYINKYNSVNNGLNNNNAFGKDKKKIKQHWKNYREKHKEKIKEKDRKYYHNNKEKCIKRNREYRKKNKDRIKKISKIYREKNKEKIRKCRQKYYEKNKEKIKQERKIKTNCPICNALIRKDTLKRHQRREICLKVKKNTYEP